MARYVGKIGFGSAVETVPGVWEDVITERKYYGDILRTSRRLEETSNLNNDLTITNTVSIIADGYARANLHAMAYIMFAGKPWTISSVDVEERRLILRLGEVYNGDTAPTPNAA